MAADRSGEGRTPPAGDDNMRTTTQRGPHRDHDAAAGENHWRDPFFEGQTGQVRDRHR